MGHPKQPFVLKGCTNPALRIVRGKTIVLTLQTGVLSKTFAMKSCTNPARHIFPWFTGEAIGLHTGVLSKTFAIKSCTNPARHIFPWLPGEAPGLHTGVLTKKFAMSVLYLKTIDVFFKENKFEKSVH